jgi:hypothetical protein
VAVNGGQGNSGEQAKRGSGVAIEVKVKVERTSSVRASAGISPYPRGVEANRWALANWRWSRSQRERHGRKAPDTVAVLKPGQLL